MTRTLSPVEMGEIADDALELGDRLIDTMIGVSAATAAAAAAGVFLVLAEQAGVDAMDTLRQVFEARTASLHTIN